jgi:redox-sensitive bicupin YhaK (pirin superfamily)
MTAGSGMQHAEMFPLVNPGAPNPLHLFQIWLNLPQRAKFSPPHYKMLWSEEIPVVTQRDAEGRTTEVTLIAGTLDGVAPPAPTPDSWAAGPANDVAIWIVKMAPGARWTLPAAPGTRRRLYFHAGSALSVAGDEVTVNHALGLASGEDVELRNGPQEAALLLLGGRPIGEPVAQYGPFVMNTQEEIRQAYADYRRTQFGGWPWGRPDPVHPRNRGRFARYADGREETPG